VYLQDVLDTTLLRAELERMLVAELPPLERDVLRMRYGAHHYHSLAYTRYSFVVSGIVHQSILLLALGTTSIAPLCIMQSILGGMVFLPSPLFRHSTHNIGIGSANIV